MASFQSRLQTAMILGLIHDVGLEEKRLSKLSTTIVPPSEPSLESPEKSDSPIEAITATCSGSGNRELSFHQNMQDSSPKVMTPEEDREFANQVLFPIQLMGVDVLTKMNGYTELSPWDRKKRLKREKDRGETTKLTAAEEKRLRKQAKRLAISPAPASE